jgi:hypothetical protein
MSLPNLFLSGAPKCGTTSLHDWLGQHPAIHMSRRKEPKYWLSPGVRPQYTGPGDHIAASLMTVDREKYEALFDDRGEAVYAGESSPYYLWDVDALRRIRAEIPDARILAVLRRPADRALSNWAHNWQDGRERIADVAAAVHAEAERRAAGWEPFWYYESLGRYGEQVERLRSVFPEEQVHLELFDDLRREPQETVGRIFRFLGLDPFEVDIRRSNTTTYYGTSPQARLLQRVKHEARTRADRLPKPVRHRGRDLLERAMARFATSPQGLDRDVSAQLTAIFAEDVEKLGDLGVDVSRWTRAS